MAVYGPITDRAGAFLQAWKAYHGEDRAVVTGRSRQFACQQRASLLTRAFARVQTYSSELHLEPSFRNSVCNCGTKGCTGATHSAPPPIGHLGPTQPFGRYAFSLRTG